MRSSKKIYAPRLFYMVAFALLASWFLILLWFKQSAQFPLDFDGLWDASEKPRLRARLLGMQTLRSGATIEVVDGNPAFALGGERAVMLGAWPIPRHDSMGSWAAWVKLLQPLPMDVVPFAGTAPPLNWGFGAVDGRPAAWMVQRNLNGEKEVNRIVSENPFPIDEWVHLAVVLTPGRMMLWVNGQLAKDGIYNAANPEDPDVWLGRVRRTLGMLHPANSHAFGLPAPPFLLDDYVHFPRSLTPNEVKAISNAGRDGVARAESRLELLDKLRSHSITAVLISLGFALCGALQTLSSLVMKLFQPVFASVWLILLIGGSLTSWATLKLWRAAARSDADKLDLFADQLRYSSETSFGRIADLLRRARDYVRANPQATLAEMNAWAQENGAVHDYSGIDGIGWAPVVRTDKDRQLPVRAYTGIVAADHDGWFWDGSYEVLRQNVDVAATGLVRLRPTASAEHRDKYGIRL